MDLQGDGTQIVTIGSVADLEKLSGRTGIDDIHKDKIDDITIPDPRGADFPPLKRVEEVFDCWFESGSMPYAQQHYPFENKEIFENGFPADFIAEGLDQTRGWFYTLMVISTGLFDKPAFKNLIVNGLVLAADGKKMSKRLKNYPDPTIVVRTYGADALRLYLINSPVVRSMPLKFNEPGVLEVVKKVFLPWWNAYRFMIENATKYEKETKTSYVTDLKVFDKVSNVMDKWIFASLHSLIQFVRGEMAAYRLYTVVPHLLTFIHQLTNWYVRFNRNRIKGKGNSQEDCKVALDTLFVVLYSLCRIMAPFTPFLVENMYQNLKKAIVSSNEADCEDSVHYMMIPEFEPKALDSKIELAVKRMQNIIELGRQAREKRNVSLKTPLKKMMVLSDDAQLLKDVQGLEIYVHDELNVQQLEYSDKVGDFIKVSAAPNKQVFGKKYGKRMGEFQQALAEASHATIVEAQQKGSIVINGETLDMADIEVTWTFNSDDANLEACNGDGAVCILDCGMDQTLLQQGMAREVINRVQKLRKKAGLSATDEVEVFYSLAAPTKVDFHAGVTQFRDDPILGNAVRMMEEGIKAVQDSNNEKIAGAPKKVLKAAAAAATAEATDAKSVKEAKATGGKNADSKGPSDKELKALANKKAREEKNKAISASKKEASEAKKNEYSVDLAPVIADQKDFIAVTIGRAIHDVAAMPAHAVVIDDDETDVNGAYLHLYITRMVPVASAKAIAALLKSNGLADDSTTVDGIVAYFANQSYDDFKAAVLKRGQVEAVFCGKKLVFKLNEHVFLQFGEFMKQN